MVDSGILDLQDFGSGLLVARLQELRLGPDTSHSSSQFFCQNNGKHRKHKEQKQFSDNIKMTFFIF